MKVLIATTYEDSEGNTKIGRSAWLNKDSELRLTVGSIYTTEETACDKITENDLNYIKELNEKPLTSKVIIQKIIGRKMTHPLMIKKVHVEYGFELMFFDTNMAIKTKHHVAQRFGNEQYKNDVGSVGWYAAYNTSYWK